MVSDLCTIYETFINGSNAMNVQVHLVVNEGYDGVQLGDDELARSDERNLAYKVIERASQHLNLFIPACLRSLFKSPMI